MSVRTALAASFLIFFAAGCAEEQAPVAEDPAPSGSTSEQTQEPSEDPSATDSTDEETDASTGSTVPVYYVGDTDRAGPRLYREFRRVSGDPLEQAAALLTSGEAADPDYRTLYPGGDFQSVTYEAGTIVVTVSDDSWNTPAPGMTRAEARLAVQQLVYTLQGVQQERAPVEVRSQGGAAVPLFGVDTSGGVRNASPLEVLSHANITSPEQGSVVKGGELQVSGVGNSFEANLGWELRQGDRVVRDGFVTMKGWMADKLFPFEFTVDVSDLPAGDYTVWVTTDDPTGGTEGVGAMTDDKDVTVR